MTDQRSRATGTGQRAAAGRYEVRLPSHGGKIVYARTLNEKRVLETAERIMAKAEQKLRS